MDPILIPTWIATVLIGLQVNAGIQNNAKYNFAIDKDSTVVIMNSQTGHMWRCNPDLKVCTEAEKGFDAQK